MILHEKRSLVDDMDQLIIQVYTAGYYLTGCRDRAEHLCALVFDKYDRSCLGTHEKLVWHLFCQILLQCCDKRGGIGGNIGSQPDLLLGAEAVQRALLELPPRERIAVILKYKIGLNGETIASCMDCTISCVSRLLAAGKRKLRKNCFGQ